MLSYNVPMHIAAAAQRAARLTAIEIDLQNATDDEMAELATWYHSLRQKTDRMLAQIEQQRYLRVKGGAN